MRPAIVSLYVACSNWSRNRVDPQRQTIWGNGALDLMRRLLLSFRLTVGVSVLPDDYKRRRDEREIFFPTGGYASACSGIIWTRSFTFLGTYVAAQELVPAAPIIDAIGRVLNYSRSHVAQVMRRHARKLGARRVNRRWVMRAQASDALMLLVQSTSGPRYKLGEKGPRA
jgi:hypothetical protein